MLGWDVGNEEKQKQGGIGSEERRSRRRTRSVSEVGADDDRKWRG